MHTLSQDAYKPPYHPHIHSPRRESGVESDVKGYRVCGLLADLKSSAFIAKDTHRKITATQDLKVRLEISFGTDMNH